MKNKFKICLLSFLISPLLLAQSPWLQGKNNAFVQVGFSGIYYNEVKTSTETISGLANFRDVTIQLYSEYGISDKLDILAVLPYKFIGYDGILLPANENLTGIGNITLGLKYKICDGTWKLSAGLNYIGNSIKANADKGLRTGFESNTYLPYISIGSATGKWYYFGNLGYGYMSNNYSDYLKIGGEVGYKFIKNTHIIAITDLRNTFNDATFENNSNYEATGFYLDGQKYLAAGLKLNHEFIADKIGANISTIGAFNLENAPNAPSINIGFYTKF
jgi:hypothetical protein